MSVSSFLNFAHTSPLADVMSARSQNFGPAAHLIQHNRTIRFLKSQGYRFVFFPSSSYSPARSNSEADEQLTPNVRLGVGRVIQKSEISMEFLPSALLRAALPRLPTEMEVRTQDVALKFHGLVTMQRGP